MPHAALLELPPDVQSMAEREVRPGERIVWARQPTFRFASASTIVPMLFAVPFTAFAVFWIVGAAGVTRGASTGAPWSLFPLFGLPFVLVGLAMFTAPIWIKRSMAGTVYVVTDRRAIVLKRGLFGGLTSQSFEPDRVARMQRVERADGSGDLVFEVFTQRRGTDVTTSRHGFLSVAGVREVEDLLRRTLLDGRVRNL